MHKNILFKKTMLSLCLLLSFNSLDSYASSQNTKEYYETDVSSFGGSGLDYYRSVVGTRDGGFVTVGYSTSTDLGFTNKGAEDAIIVKYNENGVEEWSKSFGGSGNDYFRGVVETKDGGYVATGYSNSTNAGFTRKGEYDAIIVKYDKNGNQEWVTNSGGSGIDYVYSIAESQDGGFIVAGCSGSTNAGFAIKGYFDAIIIKYDSQGNQQWIKNAGGRDNDYFYSVTELQDGGFVAVGNSLSTDAGFVSNGNYDAIAVKFDKDGNQLWIKNFGGSGKDYFRAVTATLDGGFVTAGETPSNNAGFVNKGGADAIMIKYDKDGNQEFVKSFGGTNNDYYYFAKETKHGGFIAIGYSNSTNAGFKNNGEYDAIMVKYNSRGNQEWVKSFGGAKSDYVYSAVETQNGDFMAVGYSYSVDTGITNNGECDAVMIKLRKDKSPAEIAVEKAISTLDIKHIEDARNLVNKMEESEEKLRLTDLLNSLSPDLTINKKDTTANIDLYIKSQNMLSLSLDTNSITFKNYSGVEDLEMLGAVNISINSSLPYQLNAYLPSEIANSDKSKTLPIDILNIRDSSEADYKQFTNTTDKIVLKDGCVKGNDKVHTIDLKLASNQAHKADVYKTVIKFEAEQK